MPDSFEPSEKPVADEDSPTGMTTWATPGGGTPGAETPVGISPFSEILRRDSPEATSSLKSSCGGHSKKKENSESSAVFGIARLPRRKPQ